MTGFSARTLGPFVCAILLVTAFPAEADPFFVRVYGRTYKIDPQYPPNEPKGPKPQEAMKALPSDIGRGPGYRPTHEQVLAEVEERLWIAKGQLDHGIERTTVSPRGRDTESDSNAVRRETTETLAAGGQTRSPELQQLYDRHRALNLLARELRRSLDLPVRTPESGFSRPKLSPEIEASYRDLSFDPIAAYYGFRRVKAAFRSGDVALLSSVSRYPIAVTGRIRRTIRNPEQLRAAKDTVMDARIRDAVAKSTFETVFVRDKGMMLGEGAVWITHDKAGFALGAINLD